MVVHKRKKKTRQRAHTTHGYGSMKKHRGAGHRGGRGNAGSGKRADSKKPSIKNLNTYFGKHGFKKKNIKTIIQSVNLKTIADNLNNWIHQELVKEEGGVYVIDGQKVGFNKLLSSGKISKKMKITVPFASKKAVEKVQNAGGSVEGLTA